MVVSIIAVLAGLLLPAINAAREAARRTGCSVNQTRLAIAMSEFDSRQGYLPGWRNRLPLAPGVKTDSGNTYRQASWAVMLLPHIERTDVLTTMLNNEMWGDLSSKQGILLPEFLCPSFQPKTQRYAYSVLHYGVNVGTGINRNDGVLVDNFQGSIRQSLADVSEGDGLKGTFLHSEGAFESWPGGWGPAWHIVEAELNPRRQTVFGNNKLLPFGLSGSPLTKVLNGSVRQLTVPRSRHPGGVVMAFCDGSTKFVKDSLAPHVFAHLTTSRSSWSGSDYTPVNSTNANRWLRASSAPPASEEPLQVTESDY